MIDADYTHQRTTRTLYGIPGQGTRVQKVTLTPTWRGGLLSRASVLLSFVLLNRTSPGFAVDDPENILN
jgi:hypothetical protein